MLASYKQSYEFSGKDFKYYDYETHPRRMDNASTMQRHDNLRRQISAYEKLLQHAISKFSTAKCHQMLKALCRDASAIPELPTMDPTASSHRLVSVRQLQEMLRGLEHGGRRHSLAADELTHVRRYFDGFFEDLSYLKELKRNFDVKVYMCLYEYFYDPTDDLEDEGVGPSQHRAASGHDDMRWEMEEEEAAARDVELESLSPRQKLSHAVKHMYRVNHKWERLYTDDELLISWFDPDSFQQLMNLDNFYVFEPLLRLVPDVFTKAFKSIEMAKLWWTQYSRIYPDSAHLRRSSADFDVKMEKLENEISKLVIEMMREEDNLIKWQQDLKGLRSRELRYQKLSKECEVLESRRVELLNKFRARLAERETLKSELTVHVKGTSGYKNTRAKLQDVYELCVRAKKDLNVATYQFDLAQGDLNVELLVRPDMIIFIADLEEKIARAELFIAESRQTKRKTEKRLTLIKTNTQNMRRMMEKILGTDDALRLREPSPVRPKTPALPPPPPPPPAPRSSPEVPRKRATQADDDRWEDLNDDPTEPTVHSSQPSGDRKPPKPIKKKEPSIIRDGKYDGISKEDAFRKRDKII